MSHDYRRVENAFQLLSEYSGDIPLDNYLRSCFKQNKNWGSKDRKAYREICFRFFRYFRIADLNKEIVTSINDSINSESSIESAFNPFEDLGIDSSEPTDVLGEWFRSRPPVFVTGNADKLQVLKEELDEKNLKYIDHDSMLELPGQISEAHFPILKNLQVMDRGSLTCCLGLNINERDLVWDSCCGAGGKSFALSRYYSPENFIASDIRKKCLSNLQKRALLLNQFMITEVVDASESFPSIVPSFIFVDAPCSGSGTWRRNPDRAAYFNANEVEVYAEKQRAIMTNMARNSEAGTQIVYVTCSVFKAENERQLPYFEKLGLKVESHEMLGGPSQNSDYFFRAILRKS